MIRTHVLGFPRIGRQRELKQALERYWRGESTLDGLEATGRALRRAHWSLQHDSGLDFVTVGDFAFYDAMLNHILMFGCEPARFGFTAGQPDLVRGFAMARGVAAAEAPACCPPHRVDHGGAAGADGGQPALEMTKWFDTNYHYLVPEFARDTRFRLESARLLSEVAEAVALGHTPKVVLIGPLSFLWLGKSTEAGFDRLALLDALLPAYQVLLNRLHEAGVRWVQMDEPVLGLDLPDTWRRGFEHAYRQFDRCGVSLLLASYFSPLGDNLRLACALPVSGLHIDAVRAPHEVAEVLDRLPPHRTLSVGIIDGRNVWRTDLDRALSRLRPALARRQQDLWLAPSCSLLHVPMSLSDDAALDAGLRAWLAGAREKLTELHILKCALSEGDAAVRFELDEAQAALTARALSPRVRDAAVARRIASLAADADRRATPFARRQPLQRARLALPLFPTTTIGSFPQTADIRAARAAHRRGELDDDAYRARLQAAIEHAVRAQERLGLDVLVHGEAERNDMVEYFGERLAGFAVTADGWVQSYGSRCVKPPILYGDVSRPSPMTVDWIRYAQSLTASPMKGMLTGPVTMLQWSFARDDQSRALTALQIALALRDEVLDLEAAGIAVIQIDEPALREGLPLRQADRPDYLRWATRAFRIAASGVRDDTQIHTHMCYAEFNDILPDIAAMDADVITLETSRSGMALLDGFAASSAGCGYPNDIGPGVYDIHSPRVPAADDMVALLERAAAVIAPERLWVNPDCGLKTRGWPEVDAALTHMVAAARRMRACIPAQAAASAMPT